MTENSDTGVVPYEDERYMIEVLEADAGVGRMAIPNDPDGRWDLIRSLMNVRPPVPPDPRMLGIQDRYLEALIRRRGITDADCLEYRDGICVWRGDITALRCDAIVNAANSGMLGCFVPLHRCIDNAIHSYAGIQLRLECDRMMRGAKEPTGRARATHAYNLPCRYVLHTVGPIVSGPLTDRHRADLESCYRSCLELAASLRLRTVAFCCISTGEFRFPNEEAARIAVSTVRDFLVDHGDIRVVFDVFTDRDEDIYGRLLG